VPNPPTKDNLESDHFLSKSPAVRQRLTACLRSDASNIRPFSPPSEAIEAIKEGLNRVQPRIPGMNKITDERNAFGQTMKDAVLAYKSFNGIVRTGQPLDPIVGRMTLARLDTELKNLGKPVDPKPAPLEFGSNRWNFSFFCNRGLFGKGIYSFFVSSAEFAQESKNFDIDEVFASGALVTGFKGETRGSFTTAKKMLAKDFSGCVCDIALTRASQSLQGTLRLEKIVPDGVFSVSILLPRFRDETLGLTQGTSNIRGKFRT
jgi:hypothetical protein